MAENTEDSNRDDRVYRIDGLFPKIDGWENFPTEALWPIFAAADDITLLNLASVHIRYEPIVLEVFKERYVNKYFVVEGESERQQEVYSAQLSLFGSSIRAIRANHIRHIDNGHWMAQLLLKYTPNLEKLWFHECSFENVDDFFSQYMNLTHLTFQGGSCTNGGQIHLPDYRDLKALELIEFRNISKPSLVQILQNNPQMESLVLKWCRCCYFTSAELMKLVRNHLKHLKQLNVLERSDDEGFFGSRLMDFKFVSSLKSLESFGCSIYIETLIDIDLLSCLKTNCTNIKHLELCRYFGFNIEIPGFSNQVIPVLCAFVNVETLSLINCREQEQIEHIVEHFPRLRKLSISMLEHRTDAQILSLIRKCKQLEALVIESAFSTRQNEDAEEVITDYKLNSNFHDEFIRTIQSPHTKIEFKEDNKLIGLITKTEIIWRNKLLHWVGYDPIHNHSNLHLLDLATVPKGSKVEHKQPLNVIFNYLDLNCLFAFSRANKKCKQLVDDYIFERCEQQSQNSPEKLFITDEFGINYNGLRFFGKCVSNLEIVLLKRNTPRFREGIKKYCKNLTFFRYRTHFGLTFLHHFIFPQVRHLIAFTYENSDRYLNQFECNLRQLSRFCPNLETLDVEGTVCFSKHSPDEASGTGKKLFPKLQRIKFKTHSNDESEVKYVEELFKNTDTEVIHF